MEMDYSILSLDELMTNIYKCLESGGVYKDDAEKYVTKIFSILKDGGEFTVGVIQGELNDSWFDGSLLNTFIFECILEIMKREFKYTVNSHTLH